MIVSALVLLFLMYVVAPVIEFIIVAWPFILAAVGVFIAAMIFQALREGDDPGSETQGYTRSAQDSKLPAALRQPDPARTSAYQLHGGSSNQAEPPNGEDALTAASEAFHRRLNKGLSGEDAATIAALSMHGARGINKYVGPNESKSCTSSGEKGMNRQRMTPSNSRVVDAPPGVPTRGLVIMEEPLNKILQGRKTMELRSKHNRQLGLIALIRKGSGKIYGVAEIVESIGPMSFDEFCAHANEHAVEPERLREIFDMGWNHGWRLRNIMPLKSPVSYIHKGMSQVKLDPGAIEALSRQLARI